MSADDFSDRVNKLLSDSNKNSQSQTDDELAKRFQNVFSAQPIASQKNPTTYHIPNDAYNDDIDKEIEKMLQDSDDDDIDDYIYGVIGSSSGGQIQEKMDGFQKIFLGSESGAADDEAMELIRKLQEENALDEKYSQFTKSRDDDMEQRYLALKKDPPTFSSTYNGGEKPKGSVPKPLEAEHLEDEMDSWCCICNDDATIECEGCEDDNRYCKECFYHTHKSESADYEATKHKSKHYRK